MIYKNPVKYTDPDGREDINWAQVVLGIYVYSKKNPNPNGVEKLVVQIGDAAIGTALSNLCNMPVSEKQVKDITAKIDSMNEFLNKAVAKQDLNKQKSEQTTIKTTSNDSTAPDKVADFEKKLDKIHEWLERVNKKLDEKSKIRDETQQNQQIKQEEQKNN